MTSTGISILVVVGSIVVAFIFYELALNGSNKGSKVNDIGIKPVIKNTPELPFSTWNGIKFGFGFAIGLSLWSLIIFLIMTFVFSSLLLGTIGKLVH